MKYDTPQISQDGTKIEWFSTPAEEVARQVAERIANDREGKVKEALITQGWTPPPSPQSVSSDTLPTAWIDPHKISLENMKYSFIMRYDSATTVYRYGEGWKTHLSGFEFRLAHEVVCLRLEVDRLRAKLGDQK